MQLLTLFPDEPAFGYAVQLDGVSYRLSFYWEERAAGWYLDLADAQGEPIISGIRLDHRKTLWARYRADERLPAGDALCFSMADDKQPPTFESLGRNTVLVYYEAGEVVANPLVLDPPPPIVTPVTQP